MKRSVGRQIAVSKAKGRVAERNAMLLRAEEFDRKQDERAAREAQVQQTKQGR